MKRTLFFDFSRVLLHPRDKNYKYSLNDLYRSLLEKKTSDFFEHFQLNKELLDYLKTIKNTSSLYIVTSGTIQNAPEIRNTLDKVFNTIYSAKELNLSKKDPQIYLLLANKLDKKPQEIAFIDDTIENITAASLAGLKTIHFKSNKQVIESLKSI